ncbi:phage tail protein [Pseudomonas chlororaphis]
MAWLRAGTVAVTNGSTTVTGTATGFAANTRVGDAFIGPDGRQYELANVASDTVISITPAYQGVTASGASYAIMPVQGYQKSLADQVRDWVNTYGAKMAALGTTGNYDILPLNKGGTGNTTGTAQKLVSSAMVGTVSQSGGVPTGAIIERGTNANGEFTKFADGTMICSKVYTRSNVAFSQAGAVSISATVGNEQFPATFAAEPYQATTFEGVGIVLWTGSAWGSPSTHWAQTNAVTGYSVAGPYTFVVRRYAVGRWF